MYEHKQPNSQTAKQHSLIVLTTALAFSALSSSAYADLPLVVDNLMAAPNKWRLDTTVSYINKSQNVLAEPQAILVEVEPGKNILVPAPSQQQSSVVDAVVISPNIHYGLTDDSEVYARLSALTQTTKLDTQPTTANKSNSIKDVWLGLQHQFVQEGVHPALIGFTEVAVRERDNALIDKVASSSLVGLTTYRINDPVVLSLTASYLYAGKRRTTIDKHVVSPSDVLSVNAMSAFAVNPDITLNTGVAWNYIGASHASYQPFADISQTQTFLNLGLAYALSARTTCNLNVKTNISGSEGSTVSFQLSRKLGELPESRVSKLRQKTKSTQPQPNQNYRPY